jgi:hypothetical protein
MLKKLVVNVMNQIPLPFQRALIGDKLTKQLSHGRDKFTQDLHDKVNLLFGLCINISLTRIVLLSIKLYGR